MSLTVTTYIRTQDTDKYLAIQQKGRGAWTEFIHNALNQKKNPRTEGYDIPMKYMDKLYQPKESMPIKTSKDARKVAEKIAPHVNYLKK